MTQLTLDNFGVLPPIETKDTPFKPKRLDKLNKNQLRSLYMHLWNLQPKETRNRAEVFQQISKITNIPIEGVARIYKVVIKEIDDWQRMLAANRLERDMHYLQTGIYHNLEA